MSNYGTLSSDYDAGYDDGEDAGKDSAYTSVLEILNEQPDWTPDTLENIAGLLTRKGYEITEVTE